MYKFMRKHGIAIIAFCIAAAIFATGFVYGRYTVNAQQPQTEQTEQAEANDSDDAETPAPTVEAPVYVEYELTATAYCACEKCCGVWATKRPHDENGKPIVYTASGTVAKAGRTVAADTSVFPFGTVLIIDGTEYVVEDRGGAIKGNRIDVYFDSHEDALQFGRRTLNARVEIDSVKGGY